MGNPAFDPADTDGIGSNLLAYFARQGGDVTLASPPMKIGNGLDTYVYAFAVSGAPPPWDRPLILRVYPSTGQAEKARREAGVQTFAADAGFPAPRPIALETQDSPLGLPFMIMERVPGVPAMDRLKNPFAIFPTTRRLGELQARLHQLPVDGSPLPSGEPLVDRLLEQTRDDVARHGVTDVGELLDWVEANKVRVASEALSMCHNDFHPLNVMMDGDQLYLLDWSDAALGDRHCDLARTLALFWLAPPLARSPLERLLLTLARGRLIATHRRAYECILPIDEDRLKYWQALHALRALVQVRALRTAGEEAIGAREGALDSIPGGFEDSLVRYFQDLAQ